MSIETAWLEAIDPVTGLDQLGVRTTAIRMYSHLVPGVTNVTDRARYFSLHSYLVHHWAKERANDDMDAFYQTLRRAECLIGLADAIYDREDAYAVVGTRKIDGWLSRHGSLKAADRVPVARISEEYFGNSRGGFGQYYAGAEADLGLVQEVDGVVRLVEPNGKALAAAYAKAAERIGLSALLQQDNVPVARMKEVGEVLGFGRAAGEERRALREVLLDEGAKPGSPGSRRRQTILLILALAAAERDGIDEPNWDVQIAALHSRLPSGGFFAPPAPLRGHVERWRVYAMHEHLCFALETMLTAAVEEVGEMEMGDGSGDVALVAARLGDALPKEMRDASFADLIAAAKAGVRVGKHEKESDPYGEQVLRSAVEEALANRRTEALASSVRLFARLAARVMGAGNPYGPLNEEGMLIERRRLSLIDLAAVAETAKEMTCREFLVEIARKAIAAHLRVACAKLVHNRIYTYKVAYEGGVLTKVESTWPAFSSPRLQKVAQMCSDVGLLTLEDGVFTVTAEGRSTLERFECA